MDFPQTLLGEDTGYHNEAKHHCQNEVEEIVSRVDGSNTDTEREKDKTGSLFCKFDGAIPIDQTKNLSKARSQEGFEEGFHGRHVHLFYRGTTTRCRIPWMISSASSEGCWEVSRELRITRWERIEGARFLMSSGRQKSRPDTKA
jgi:hypothetical protein